MTKIISKSYHFKWTIQNPRQLFESETELQSPVFSANGDDLKWYLKFQFNDQKLRVLTLSLENDECLKKYSSVHGYAEISTECFLFEKQKAFSSSFIISDVLDIGSRTCHLGRFKPNQIEKFIVYDEFDLFCELDYMKESHGGNSSSSLDPNWAEVSKESIVRDIEQLHTDDYFSDMTISIKDKNYRVHKCILATRCPVFDAMFRSDMQESKKNHITLTDIEQETFEEMLHYIYTGKTRNLDVFAFELLQAADKYDLGELKKMCAEVLMMKLSTSNAARVLILADTHNAEELKTCALRFIKDNYSSCDDFNNTDVWKHLSASNYHLIKDIMTAMSKK